MEQLEITIKGFGVAHSFEFPAEDAAALIMAPSIETVVQQASGVKREELFSLVRGQ